MKVFVGVVVAGLFLVSCAGSGAGEREESAVEPVPTAPDSTPGSATEPISTDGTEVDPALQEFYLPQYVPDGYEVESLTQLTPPEEVQTADPEAARTLILGDSEELSDTSVLITSKRFATPDELRHALWVEDALMVVNGGPKSTMSVEGAIFVYDDFPGFDGGSMGGQFHVVIDDVLVSGLILGPLDDETRDDLLSTIVLDEDGISVSVSGDVAGLTELGRTETIAAPGYEIRYSNGTSRFSVALHPGISEATIAAGSFNRDGGRLEGSRGSGFIEAQPEVGGALGARRLVWWVPTVRVQIWFGGSGLSDDDAIAIADSMQQVDRDAWDQAMQTAAIEEIDYGVLNLPEDPRQAFLDREAESERAPEDIGARPDLDIADIVSFVADFRGGQMPADLTITWLGPLEAEAATSGVNFFPAPIGDVLAALHAMRMSDGTHEFSEQRRSEISGACCLPDGIQLIEGLDDDAAAVVAAHEFVHFFDITVAGAQFVTPTELLNPGQALREGNATRVMIEYRDARGLRYEPFDYDYERSMGLRVGVKRVLRFAYWDGLAFAQALAEAGGEEAIDRALTDRPPLSTEHILHPDHYLAGDVPLEVALPEAPEDAQVTSSGTLGAYVVALAAEQELGWEDAVELAGEWSGDSFVLWSGGFRQPCIAATIVFDTASAAERFVAAVGGVANEGTVSLEQCSR